MKQLILLIITIIIISTAGLTLQTKITLEKTYISKNVLDISNPINGRIDTEFLDKL